MRLSVALAALAVHTLLACSSSPPSPEAPAQPAAAGEPATAGPAETGSGDPVALPGTVMNRDNPQGTVPDDYTLSNTDCDALGKQYGQVARSDQMAALSPKLS